MFLCCSIQVKAQQEMTREERIKVLQLLRDSDTELEKSTLRQNINDMPENINNLELPPLSVFLVVCLIHLKQPINGTYYNYPCNNKNYSHHVGITIIIICHRCFVQV